MDDFSYDEIEMLELAKKHGLSVEFNESTISGKAAYNLVEDGKSVSTGRFYKVQEFLRNLEKAGQFYI